MHTSAMLNGKAFFEAYGPSFASPGKLTVVDIGSLDVNGSLRTVTPPTCRYVGVDFSAGNGVDVVLSDPYSLPFEDDSIDVVLSSSCFEHSELFWLVFLEILRILTPRGLFYLNAPSNGDFHRYPVDCWRFYPDSGNALVAWARRNGMHPALLESFTSHQDGSIFNDFVAVFLKDETNVTEFPRRILDFKSDVTNGLVHGRQDFVKPSAMTEDRRRLAYLAHLLSQQTRAC